ncbi:hypothetical protein AB0346_00405 [Nocardia beijingensis]|uniref:hypothetical protein n=1 Tax=Nocardia beijingensis TaxID=95162 RepID=UPI0034504AD0
MSNYTNDIVGADYREIDDITVYSRSSTEPLMAVNIFRGHDGALVVQLDTREGTGRVRVRVNDAPVFDDDPEIYERRTYTLAEIRNGTGFRPGIRFEPVPSSRDEDTDVSLSGMKRKYPATPWHRRVGMAVPGSATRTNRDGTGRSIHNPTLLSESSRIHVSPGGEH